MTKKFVVPLLLLAASVVFAVQNGTAQVDLRDYTFWIRAADDFSAADTAVTWFINVHGGSYNLDSIPFCVYVEDACDPYSIYVEYEPPPSPPNGLWVLFTGFRPPSAGTYGGYPIDIHGIPNNPARKDTFQLRVQYFGSDADFSDFHVRWQDSSFIASNCDSMFLVAKTLGLLDGAGNPLAARIDMRKVNHIDLRQPIQNAGTSTFTFHIYRYGVPAALGVPDADRSRIPSRFVLGQNYPNPFNPSTTITFDLPTRASSEIAVYNVLGARVATLTSADLSAGTHTATWNGLTSGGLPASSGVYFVRMTASSASPGLQFTAVRKIVLMK